MQLKQLIFWLIPLALCFPATANASDIDVKAGNVRVKTETNGSISVNTSSNRVEIEPNRRSSSPWWQDWNYWNRSSRNCSSRTYQRSTQTTSSNGTVQTTSVSTNTCR